MTLRTKPDTGTALSLTRDGIIAALTFSGRETISDAWRISQQEVREDIRFINQYRKVLAEKDVRLHSGHRVHSASYVETCRINLATTGERYLRHIRQITEAEQEMDRLGIPFARSSDAWTPQDLSCRAHPHAA